MKLIEEMEPPAKRQALESVVVADEAKFVLPNKDPVLIVSNCDPRLTKAAIRKIFGKFGNILEAKPLAKSQGAAGQEGSSTFRVEFDRPADASRALGTLNGKKALSSKLLITYETKSRGLSAEQKIQAISEKLDLLDRGIEHADTVGRVKPPKQTENSFIFNKSGESQAVYNGLGTTRTKQNSTLYVTNIPRHVQNSRDFEKSMGIIFKDDPGYFGIRFKRRMCFVDFESIADATKAMIKHQNQRLPGVKPDWMGLMIDYDKDCRSKRNRAYEAGRNKQK